MKILCSALCALFATHALAADPLEARIEKLEKDVVALKKNLKPNGCTNWASNGDVIENTAMPLKETVGTDGFVWVYSKGKNPLPETQEYRERNRFSVDQYFDPDKGTYVKGPHELVLVELNTPDCARRVFFPHDLVKNK